MQEERQQLVRLIDEAVSAGARIKPACHEAEISFHTYKRWNTVQGITEDKRPIADRDAPSNKLSQEEIQAILDTCNQAEYSSLPPSQIVPRLADEGIYLASESSFYRVLKTHKQLNHRKLPVSMERIG